MRILFTISILVLVLVCVLWGGLHAPNSNKICQRPGCGHYKSMHSYDEHGSGGICAFFASDGCTGFVK